MLRPQAIEAGALRGIGCMAARLRARHLLWMAILD